MDQYSGALTVVLAAFAVIPGFLAIRSAKQDSRDRSRPVIVAELQRHPDSERPLLLVVRNAGASVARSVVITFDPPMPAEPTPAGKYPSYVGRMFAAPLLTFGPGQSLTNPWWTSPHETSAPDPCLVRASYTDSHGRAYVDEYSISVAPYLASLFVEASDSTKGLMKTLAEEATKHTAALQTIAGSLQPVGDERPIWDGGDNDS